MQKGEPFPLYGKQIEAEDTNFPASEMFRLLHFTDTTFGDFLPHSHDTVELILVLDGDVGIFTHGEQYRVPKGGLALMPPRQIHNTVILQDIKRYERIVCHFYIEYVTELFRIINLDKAPQWLSFVSNFDFLRQVHVFELSPGELWTFRTLFERMGNVASQDEAYLRGVSPCLLAELCIEIEHQLRTQKKSPVPITNNLVSAVVDYIEENFTNPELALDDIRQSVFVSQGHLSRVFKDYVGDSVYNYLIRRRLCYAKELLEKGNTVMDSCLSCGYTDYASFLKAFKKAFGQSPSQYRKECRERQRLIGTSNMALNWQTEKE